MDEQKTDETGGTTTAELLRAPTVEAFILTDDGIFPNNRKLPLLVYRQVLNPDAPDLVSQVQTLFAQNHWGGSWVNAIYDFHHYHSTAHEVLAVCSGQARVQFGGVNGITLTLSAGDVVLIPAGVAHKNLGSEGNLVVAGAYPRGQEYDMRYGRHEERPEADKNIVCIPLPEADPLYGLAGPLTEHWRP